MSRRAVLWLLIVLIGASAPLWAGAYTLTVLNFVCLHAIVVVGLVILTGIVGLISFGQAALVGLGAYISAYLTTSLGMSPWVTLFVALAACAALAYLIGHLTLRMGGHFLAIATLAWSLSLFYLFGNLSLTGGYSGLGGIPPLTLFSVRLDTDARIFPVILATLVGVLYLSANLLDSRIGRALRSIRYGGDLASSVGVDVLRLKIEAFVYAAVLAGLSGWLYAHMQRFVNPTPFNLDAGIEYLFMAVIGGAGDLGGAIVGAFAVTMVKDWLQDLMTKLVGQAGNFEIIVFGAVMLLILHRAKSGAWPALKQLLPRPLPRSIPDAAPFPLGKERPQRSREILRVDKARRTFGGLVAVNEVSFDVHAAQVVGLLGPNGAGKSTMFNLISGLLAPTSGTIVFDGKPIGHLPSRKIALAGVGRTFQHVKIVRNMSLLDNVALGCWGRTRAGWLRSLLRFNRAEENAAFADAAWQLDRVGLGDHKDDLAGSLPLGKQRLLEIARALAVDPLLLLLDEPAAGLRALEKAALAQLLNKLRDEGVAILLVEHDVDFIMNLADRIVVMNFGERIAMGGPAEVRTNPQVIEAYLGSEA